MLPELKTFHEWLCENYPASSPKLSQSKSGQITLELQIEAETYALEHHPTKGFSLSKLGKTTLGWEPVGKPSRPLPELKADIIGLLNG